MKKMRHNEMGGAEVVSLLLSLVILVSLLLATLDVSMYFLNRTQVQAGARDGARTVAIFGGSGRSGTPTPLEAAYGETGACDGIPVGSTGSGKNVECQVWHSLQISSSSLMNADINKVTCGENHIDSNGNPIGESSPGITTKIGQSTWCEVKWQYHGMPASPMNLFSGGTNTNESILTQESTVVGTSQAEVALDPPVSP